MSQKLTFKQLTTQPAEAGMCPYVGDIPFTGACTYWNKPEVYAKCPTKNMEEQCNLHL